MPSGMIPITVPWRHQPLASHLKINKSNALGKHVRCAFVPIGASMLEVVTGTSIDYTTVSGASYGAGQYGRTGVSDAEDTDGWDVPTAVYPPIGSENRTFAAIIRPEVNPPTNADIIWSYGADLEGERWTFKNQDSSGHLRIEVQGSGYTASVLTLTAKVWQFVGCALKGTQTKDHILYLNHASEATGSNAAILNTASTDPARLFGDSHGIGGSNTGFLGETALAVMFDSGEPWIYQEFLRNPWQIFKPRTVWIPVGVAAGGAVFNVSLSEPVDAGDSYSAIGILAGSMSEPADVSDSQSATMVGQGSVSEPVDPAETYSGLLSTLQSVTEPVDLTDSQVGDKIVNESLSEVVDVSDSQAASARAAASVSEQVEPAESSSATKQTADSVAENVDLSESSSGAALVSRDLTENVDLTESQTAVIVQVVSLSENVDASDSYTSLARAAAAINEAAELGESWAATAERIASLTDTVDLTDGWIATVPVVAVSIAEDVTAAASFAAAMIARTSLTEQVDLADAHSVILNAAASLTEQVDPADIQSALMVAGASFSEAVELADLWLATVGEIAAAVQILVAARDRRLVAEPRDTLVIVKTRPKRIVVNKLN